MTTERDVLRELETALDVSPSPGFEARVRARVSTQSMGGSLWTWPAGIAVAATVVLAVMLIPHRQSPVRSELDRAAASVPVAPAIEASKRAGRPGGLPDPKLATTVPRARRSSDPVAVVVPSGQLEAIQRLMTEVSAGHVALGPERPAAAAVLHVTALDAPPPIEFDTIRFTALSPDAAPDLWR